MPVLSVPWFGIGIFRAMSVPLRISENHPDRQKVSGEKATGLYRGTKSRSTDAVETILAILISITGALVPYYLHFNLSTAGSVELLLVVLTALYFGFRQATIVSVIAVVCLDYLFIPPLFALSISEPQDWISLATFEVTALLVSRLSSKVKLHAAAVEVERRRNKTLYEFSRAVLLIDGQSSTLDQVSSLIREFMAAGEVQIWLAHPPDSGLDQETSIPPQNAGYRAFIEDKNNDDADARVSSRVVRIGTTAIGGMVLQNWQVDPLIADSVASLVALVAERSRALQKENRAEAERKTEQLRTAVLDGLAHGFKTPLTAIQTASSGLIEIDGLNETQSELVSIIDEQATLLAQMTTRLLRTAALENQQVKLKRTHLSILSLVENVVEQYDANAQSRVIISTPDDLETIYVDSDLVQLALVQLIDNAIKYSSIDRHVDVSVSQSKLETKIVVSNEGATIRPEERERIFERFYRGIESAHGPSGTGLGLSIVRKTAEVHGGSITVDTTSGMTRFTLVIPRRERDKNG